MRDKKQPGIVRAILHRLLSLAWPGKLHTEAPFKPQRSQSVFLRHLDCGSCNGCEVELQALSNPLYDLERFGFRFVASPRHADVLIMTGPLTRNLEEAVRLTFQSMPEPRRVIVVGDCAQDGGIYQNSYALSSLPAEMVARIVDWIDGCPPTPHQILDHLLQLDTV